MDTRHATKRMKMQSKSGKESDKWTKEQTDTFVRKSNYILPRDMIVDTQLNKIKVEAVEGEEHAELADETKQETTASDLPFATPDNQDTLPFVAEASHINVSSHLESLSPPEELSANIPMEDTSGAVNKMEDYVTQVISEVDIDEDENLEIERVENLIHSPQEENTSHFKTENENLKLLLKQKQEENVVLTEEIKQLKIKKLIKTLPSLLGDSDITLCAENRKLWGKIEKCTEENVELKKKNLEQQREIQALEKSMSLSREHVYRLTSNLASKEKSLDELGVKLEELEKNFEETQKSLKERDGEIEKLRSNMNKSQVEAVEKYLEMDRKYREEGYKQFMKTLESQSSYKQVREEEEDVSLIDQDPPQIKKFNLATHSSDIVKAGPPKFPQKSAFVSSLGSRRGRRGGKTSYRKFTAMITPRIRKVSAVVKQVEVKEACNISTCNRITSTANCKSTSMNRDTQQILPSTSFSSCGNVVDNDSSHLSGSIEDFTVDRCFAKDNCVSFPAREIPTVKRVYMEPSKLSTDNNENQVSPDLRPNISHVLPASNEPSRGATTSKRSLPQKPNTASSRPRSSRIAKRQRTNVPAQTGGYQNHLDKLKPLGNPVDEMENTSLFQAVLEGKELSELKRIFEKGSSVKGKNNAGESILHLAVHHKDPEVIRFLIGAGADVNLKDNCKNLPIHTLAAVEHNFGEKLRTLCEYGADIHAKDASGNTILHLAVSAGRSKEDVELIISKSRNWKQKNKFAQTALHKAAKGGKPELIQYLIDLGADVTLKDRFGWSPLHVIPRTQLDYKGSVDVFLKHGVDINEQDENGDTLLSLSTFHGRQLADIQYIVDKGGNLELKSKKGNSVLHDAVQVGSTEVFKYFISRGVPINSKDNDGSLPIHDLVWNERNFNEMLDVLLECDASINSVDKEGNTLLGLAAYLGRDKKVLEYIVGKGASWETKNKKDRSVLHLAAIGGNVEAIKYIIALGGNIHGRDKEGNAPLHLLKCGKQNFKECLDAFLEHGAKINAKNSNGRTLLDIGYMECFGEGNLQYIISRGGTSEFYYD